MVDTTNTNPDSGLFNFASMPSNQGIFNFNLGNIEAYAANPGANISGQINPTQLASESFTPVSNNTNANGQSLMATGITSPTLNSQLVQQSNSTSGSTPSGNSNPALNSNAVSLLSTAAQHSGVGKSVLGGVTNSIDNFGASTGIFSNPGALSLGASIGDTAAIGGIDAYTSAATGLGETVSPAVAAADAAATPGAVGALGISASGILTAAGLGVLGGGLLAKALGENSTGGSIGGGIGAAAGAAIGSIIPGIGTVIGGIIGGIGGSLFGGLFGNSDVPTNATGGGGDLTAAGALSNTGQESKNPNATSTGFVASGMQNFSSVAEGANTALGIQFSPDVHFDANYSSKHGGANLTLTNSKTGESTGAISFSPNDPTSSQQAYLQALQFAATQSGYTDTAGLTKWYNDTYVNSNAGATNQAPTLPNNPHAQTNSNWQSFLDSYAAKQSAGAAPVQTTVGGQPVNAAPTQGTTNATPS